MRKFIYPIVLPLSVALTACTTIMENIPGVYTLDIQQGNVINQDMIDQLKPGMTKRQVLYVMGSSMLQDVFHQKRWDYLYSEQLGGELRKQKKVSLFFKDEKLVAIQGDFRPSIVPVGKKSKEVTVDVPPRQLDKTLAEKITSVFDDEPPVNAKKASKKAADKTKAIKKAKAASKAARKARKEKYDDVVKDEDNSLWGSVTSVFSNDDAEVEDLEKTSAEEIEDSVDTPSSQEEESSIWEGMTSVFSSDEDKEEKDEKVEETEDIDDVQPKEDDKSVWDSMTSVFSSDDTKEPIAEDVKEIENSVDAPSSQKEESSIWEGMTSVFSSDNSSE
jgi:outer membrane protein assembly factor BamE